jgi:hypothetical protein
MFRSNRKLPEMSVHEWLLRLTCAVISLGIAVVGIAGTWFFMLLDVNGAISAGNYAVAVCMGLTCISALCGAPPMATWLNSRLLRTLKLAPLPDGSSEENEPTCSCSNTR